MALKPCRECHTVISSSAKQCPHCGVSRPVKRSGVLQAIAAAVVLLPLGFCVLVLATPSPERPDSVQTVPQQTQTTEVDEVEDSGPIPQLNPTVRFTGTMIRITNTASVAWTDCEVELNAGIIRSGWSQAVSSIAPGETAEGGILAFTRSGGERFNPATHQIETVDVYCDTPAGSAFWSGKF